MSKKVRNRSIVATGLLAAAASFATLEVRHEHDAERATAETIATYLARDRQDVALRITSDITSASEGITHARTLYLGQGEDCLSLIDDLIRTPTDEEILGLDCRLSDSQIAFAAESFDDRRETLAELSAVLDDVTDPTKIEALRAIERDGRNEGFSDIFDIHGPTTETYNLIRGMGDAYSARPVGPYENNIPLLVLNGMLLAVASFLYGSTISLAIEESERAQTLKRRLAVRRMQVVLQARSQIRRIAPSAPLDQDVDEFRKFVDYVHPDDFRTYTSPPPELDHESRRDPDESD